ncbi:hypothetical protein FVE85_2692 [Porphyridium purpureum]|uniref:F-box domain-containing protein n=1 Tax=Porphyridium purpureum TaxID=35688 RepID=A0A5J4YSH6_PORPP|nr:hypothetical protein FVE85_2692 [Porphyridium purpureum]|eukprot:POR1573..scf227_4
MCWKDNMDTKEKDAGPACRTRSMTGKKRHVCAMASRTKRRRVEDDDEYGAAGAAGGARTLPRSRYMTRSAARKSIYLTDLPDCLSRHIASFLDLPDLVQLARVSKHFKAIAFDDDVWRPHLKLMLHVLFRGACDSRYDDEPGEPIQSVVPIFDRPDWSSSLAYRDWLKDWLKITEPVFLDNSPSHFVSLTMSFLHHSISSTCKCLPDGASGNGTCDLVCYHWLLHQASVKDYYYGVARDAVASLRIELGLAWENGLCSDCLLPRGLHYGTEDCRHQCTIWEDAFEGLPEIEMFGTPFLALFHDLWFGGGVMDVGDEEGL